jgi:hypothetical protein
MTVRNVSIVFSPTLGVPAGLFTLLLAEFSSIFLWKPMDPSRGSEAASPISIPPLSQPPPRALPSRNETPEPRSPAKVEERFFLEDNIQDLVPQLSLKDHVENIKRLQIAEERPSVSRSFLETRNFASSNDLEDGSPNSVAEALLNSVISPDDLSSGFPPPIQDHTDMMEVLKDQLKDLEK